MTLALTLAVAVLAFLCLLALLWSRWPAWVKGGLVLGVTMFYFLAHDIVHRLSGWPAADPMPPRFVLLAAVFDEPGARSAGGLYVWVNAIEDGKPAREPRAYRLPYTKDLHAMLDEGLKKGRQGVTQMGTAEPKGDAKGFSWLRPGRDEQVIKIRDLPAPQLPEK